MHVRVDSLDFLALFVNSDSHGRLPDYDRVFFKYTEELDKSWPFRRVEGLTFLNPCGVRENICHSWWDEGYSIIQ